MSCLRVPAHRLPHLLYGQGVFARFKEVMAHRPHGCPQTDRIRLPYADGNYPPAVLFNAVAAAWKWVPARPSVIHSGKITDVITIRPFHSLIVLRQGNMADNLKNYISLSSITGPERECFGHSRGLYIKYFGQQKRRHFSTVRMNGAYAPPLRSAACFYIETDKAAKPNSAWLPR